MLHFNVSLQKSGGYIFLSSFNIQTMFINAEQARIRADSILSKELESLRVHINTLIEKAIKNGEYKVTCYKNIPPKLWSALEEAGYKLENFPDRDGSPQITISW